MVAGLQKFIPIPELENILVVIVANLKKAKLAGTPSEAMILAAEFADSTKGPDGISVKVSDRLGSSSSSSSRQQTSEGC